ncbi:MAG: hypothetical protein HC788_05060 [Sphingopyxis sp.]|nr:hypothetical protein [Sphingopyxis sp.]
MTLVQQRLQAPARALQNIWILFVTPAVLSYWELQKLFANAATMSLLNAIQRIRFVRFNLLR